MRTVRAAWAWDLWVAITFGVGVAVISFANESVRSQGPTMLLATAALGAAFLATVLTAFSVVSTFFDSTYRRVLEEAHDGDLGPALAPYAVVAYASAAATILSLAAAIAWPAFPLGAQAVVLGVSTLLAVWSVAGSASLVSTTLFHARHRAATMRAVEQARDAQARQRGTARARSRTER